MSDNWQLSVLRDETDLTAEPNPAGTIAARLNYWKQRCDELHERIATMNWQPVTPDNLPPLGVPVWLREDNRIWVGGRAEGDNGDGWLWGNTYGSFWSVADGWGGDIETDDDYKPTHWMRLPEYPKP